MLDERMAEGDETIAKLSRGTQGLVTQIAPHAILAL
jgi:hypothetical protein